MHGTVLDVPTFADAELEEHELNNQGEFWIWGAGLYHRALFRSESAILTIRWSGHGK
jgi:hypothetical protein